MSLYAIVKRNEPSILGIFYFMAIVYIHRRKDIEDPFLNVFYVGASKNEYRATEGGKSRRSKEWMDITNQYEFTAEITHKDILIEEAYAIEKYLIAFYGRKDLGLGNLVNKYDGGEGGCNWSDKQIEYMRRINTGKKMPEETKRKIAAHFIGTKRPECACKGEKNPMYGKSGALAPSAKKVGQYSLTGELIATFDTVKEAALACGLDPRRISENCRNQRPKRKYQYKWQYIN
jgi:hypothetical protein